MHVGGVQELRREMLRARASRRSQVLVIDTTHRRTTADGGAWWEVAVPEVSARPEVQGARREYLHHKAGQRR